MGALQGLTGLYGPPVPQPAVGETGTPASDWGVPFNPEHAIPGDNSHQATSGGLVYGGDIETEPLPEAPLAGLMPDDSNKTPDVHSAPTATIGANSVNDPLIYADQRRVLHGRDLGGPNATFGWHEPYPEHLSPGTDGTIVDSPNQNVLASDVPNQLRSGSNDQTQGLGSENGYGFQFGHMIRRWFSDKVPQVMPNADERPFIGKHPVWQNRLDNNSQFARAGDISTGMMLAKTPTTDPTPWEQPANPTYRASTDYPDESGFSGGWVAG